MAEPLRRGRGSATYDGQLVGGDIRHYVRLGVLAGLAGNAIGRALRATGVQIRRQTLQAVVREQRQLAVGADILNTTPLALRPTETAFPQTQYPLRTRYRVAAVMGSHDAQGNFVRQHQVYHSFNRPMTVQALRDVLVSKAGANAAKSGLTVDDTTFQFYTAEGYDAEQG